jgi:membrane-bound metal-dependent hydrolase YbcI (DUF457 family)
MYGGIGSREHRGGTDRDLRCERKPNENGNGGERRRPHAVFQLFTSALVLIVLLFVARPLSYMPQVVLSAVVFLIGIDLINVREMRRIWRERPVEFWVAAITTAIVVPACWSHRFNHSMYYANSEQMSHEVSMLIRDAG